jgi:hypothetical protein
MFEYRLKRLKQLYEIFLNLDFSDTSEKLRSCDALFFCHDADRGVVRQGRAYSPLVDSVREDLEERGWVCQTVSHPWSKLTGDLAWGSPISINRSYFFCRICSFLKRAFSFQKDINRTRDAEVCLYKRILAKSNPKCVVTIGSPPKLALAAKELGILHVELLHGLGYTSIEWGWDHLPGELLPAGVISMDKVSTETFGKLASKGVFTIQIPHPFIRRFMDAGMVKKLPEEWSEKSLPSTACGYGRRILISLNWGYAGDHGDFIEYKGILKNGLFPEILEDVIAQTKDEIFWFFRFHPVQLRGKKYQRLIDYVEGFIGAHENAEWRWASTMPLPAVLKTCTGSISMSSMSAYDAAYMGVSSLVLCPTVQPGAIHQDWFSDLDNLGYVRKSATSFDEILNWVRVVQQKSPLMSDLDKVQDWEKAVVRMMGRSRTDEANH